MVKKKEFPFIERNADQLIRNIIKEGEDIPKKQLQDIIGSENPNEKTLEDRARILRKAKQNAEE